MDIAKLFLSKRLLSRTRRLRRNLRIQPLEGRRVFDATELGLELDVAHGYYNEAELQSLKLVPVNESLSSSPPIASGAKDGAHQSNTLTIVVDFKVKQEQDTQDIFGNRMGYFDFANFGINDSEGPSLIKSILTEVHDDFFTELSGTVARPAGQDLAIDFALGNIGTPPPDSNNYYYIQVGRGITGQHVGGGVLGVSSASGIRTATGARGNLSNGVVAGSVFLDSIRNLSNMSPANVLSSGNFLAVRNAISSTISHEIGHLLSLTHVNKANSVQAIAGTQPIMGTGELDLPNQDRVLDRSFSLTGIDGENGNAIQNQVQRLVTAVGLHSTGTGAIGDRLEANDSMVSATQVSLNQTLEGLSIHDSSDVDWFAFTVSPQAIASGTISLDMATTGGDVDMFLHDSAGNEIKRSNSFNTIDRKEKFEDLTLQSGTYFVRVTGYSAATNTYNLTMALSEVGSDRNEPNNTSSSATATLLSQTHSGLSIHNQSDEDWYEITVANSFTATGSVSIAFGFGAGNLDLYLLNSSLVEVGRSTSTSSSGEAINNLSLSAGKYYIVTKGHLGALGNYNLTVNLTSSQSNNALEPNNSQQTATPTSISRTYSGLGIDNSTDSDWFSFTVGAQEVASGKIVLSSLPGAGDLDMYLRNSSGTTIRSALGTEALDEMDGLSLSAGSYFLEVRGYSGATGRYDLIFNLATTTVTALSPDRLEPNDLPTSAFLILPVGGTQTDLTIHSTTDEDWFRFIIPSGFAFSGTISLTTNEGGGNLNIGLYDRGLLPIKDSVGTGLTDSLTVSNIVPTGAIPDQSVFYARVYGVGGAVGRYRILFELVTREFAYRDTAGLVDPGTYNWYLNDSSTGSIGGVRSFTTPPAPSTWIPLTGDWDGDGDDSIGLYNQFASVWYLNNATNGSTDSVRPFSTPLVPSSWRPIVGDWDGNGVDGIGLYDPNGSTWYLNNNLNGSVEGVIRVVTPQVPNYFIPIAGDWDGDGRDSIGLYDPYGNKWYLNNRIDGQLSLIEVQTPYVGYWWQPIVGDWNSDGRDTIGLYDPYGTSFYLNNRTDGTVHDMYRVSIPRTYGIPPTWKPIVGNWDGRPGNTTPIGDLAATRDSAMNGDLKEFTEPFFEIDVTYSGGFEMEKPPIPPALPQQHNKTMPSDVNGDGNVSPLDVLHLINLINAWSGNELENSKLLNSPKDGALLFVDVDGDAAITPLDALTIINQLNSRSNGEGEASNPVLQDFKPQYGAIEREKTIRDIEYSVGSAYKTIATMPYGSMGPYAKSPSTTAESTVTLLQHQVWSEDPSERFHSDDLESLLDILAREGLGND